MPRILLLVSIGAYGSLLYIGWTLTELFECGASEGCLGLAMHFFAGVTLAVIVLIAGTVAWLIMRRRTALGYALPIVLSTLFGGLVALGILILLSRSAERASRHSEDGPRICAWIQILESGHAPSSSELYIETKLAAR